MRPFLTTLTITALAAAALWWQQRHTIATLRDELRAPVIAGAATAQKVPGIAPKPKKPKAPPADTLRRADGSEVVTSRGMFRGMLEMTEYIRRLSRAELEALIASGVGGGNELLDPSLFALARLAELDPVAAVKKAGALARTKNDSSAFSLIMHDWLIRDRAAALKWFHAQPDTNAKAGFLGVAGMVLGQSDPELLKQLSGSIADPDLQEAGLQQSITALAMTDPKAALGRLQELPDDQSRADLLFSLSLTGGDRIPREILEAALPYTTDNTKMKGAAAMLLGQMAAKDPKAALEWTVARPPGELEFLNGPGSAQLIEQFGKLDTATMRATTKNLPPAQQDWLIASHYAGSSLDDPATLLAEASAEISSDAARNYATGRIISRVVTSGNAAALEPWITSLPSKEQAEAREVIASAKKAR